MTSSDTTLPTSSTKKQKDSEEQNPLRLKRELGSQENLMLPRQYGINKDVVFPSMNHISVALISGSQIPSENALNYAINLCMQSHPLLRCYVDGNGEPDERIDLFQMVRKGDNNPCIFTATNMKYTAKDVLKMMPSSTSFQEFESSWQSSFQNDLDNGASWCDVKDSTTPLWKLELHRFNTGSTSSSDASDASEDNKAALLFSFNHAISDQSSACRLTDQILALVVDYEENNNNHNDEDGSTKKKQLLKIPKSQSIPPSVEESVLGLKKRFKDVGKEDITLNTIKYVAGKALEEIKGPVILPDDFKTTTSKEGGGSGFTGALTTISGNAAGGDADKDSLNRKSVLAFRTLSKDTTDALLKKCRANNVSITNALSAALTITSTDFVSSSSSSSSSDSDSDTKARNYKILQSLDMRRYGECLDQGKSVGCLAGSMDLMHGPLNDNTGTAIRTRQVRVFDFAMTISDLNNLVHLTAQSKDSLGRAYSGGFTNAGIYERLTSFEYENEGDDETSGTTATSTTTKTKTKHGKYTINDIYYAASNARSGSLYRFSVITVGNEMKFTFHPASPIVNDSTNEEFADALIELLAIVATGTTGTTTTTSDEKTTTTMKPLIPENSLVLAVAAIGTAVVLSHAGGYIQFYNSIMEMKQNVEDPAEFWGALNFWIFFAVAHPILQPILWISDVLHGSPGPMVGNLVPITFILGNVIAIGAFTYVKEIRNAVNVAVLFAFVAYVGAGLDGQAGMGDFNLAVDDNYKGTQIVKGCPAYEEVRQPSMDDFNLEKYQGLWYEHKFHDWTQFKEVYDTTLGIKLTEGGQGWIDDFAVKGPAPLSAKLSWDKSPVANGAHYFLFGRVDPNDPKGILREKGFGVEFPDYIVDVLKDPESGEYKEAIQFQCLERGGVRVFEGINFMSRNSVMSEEELTAMHARAEKAGMYPYGASPEQMHTVARRPIDAPLVDNNWQAMWRAIGVDKLLQLLTESIEDGGR
ncbi:hypothetical protein FRACYDRAFT_183807 [Fragilariopsis cylindrus CCMP1102]|uniref:Uncharacterized protein n=1 Tax=Fragilariopsis cylindrus CCMP1102 TaxID=635003 RepID=A0A1E7FIQ2_9STRA|nr:hypothetical protein FRACYDRAFT_183807 [Fragilariopsis cylindrus CCMP1102]|eukprot:OEU18046.1 hypothetical protein FRACYDRAFT_183807 [Fragilariopsis cylindrus CCMP1102]